MKLPEKIKIAGHQIKIIFPYKFVECPDYISQSSFMASEIRISGVTLNGDKRANPRIVISFMEEILFFICQLYCNHEEVKRELLASLSTGVYQLFADNKEFNMHSIPSVIRIAGQNIKIKKPHYFKERTDICGQALRESNEILLSDTDGGNSFTESVKVCIFLHEIFHHIHSNYHAQDEEHNEKIIEALAQGFYQVLTDNDLDIHSLIEQE